MASCGQSPGTRRRRRWCWPWLLLIAAATYLILWWQLPMQAAFLLSRSALDRVADKALADPAKAYQLAGRWAGLYRIAGVKVLGSTVVLYLGKDRGSYGFTRVPGAEQDYIYNRRGLEDRPEYHRDFPSGDGHEDRVGSRVVGDWFVMYSSYWRVKVGWS